MIDLNSRYYPREVYNRREDVTRENMRRYDANIEKWYDTAERLYPNFYKLKGAEKAAAAAEVDRAAAEVPEKFREIINKLMQLPHIQIEIIGGWIWISGNTALYLRKIKQLGFIYSTKQKRYYLPDATRTGRGSRYTMQDIRDIYGSTTINSQVKFIG